MTQEITQESEGQEAVPAYLVESLDGKSHYLVRGTLDRASGSELRKLVEKQRTGRNGDIVKIDLTYLTSAGELARETLFALHYDTQGRVTYLIPKNEHGDELYSRLEAVGLAEKLDIQRVAPAKESYNPEKCLDCDRPDVASAYA